jgi:hypothetical protein
MDQMPHLLTQCGVGGEPAALGRRVLAEPAVVQARLRVALVAGEVQRGLGEAEPGLRLHLRALWNIRWGCKDHDQ